MRPQGRPYRLEDVRILLGVSGGIAAYKACDLASRLVKERAEVQVVMTRNARRFVTPLSFEALTGKPCLRRAFQPLGQGASPYPHIDSVLKAQLLILAPATANLMARLAHGLADELLTTLCLMARCPILLCPAMNVQMWEHPATQANLRTLRSYGYRVLGPASGLLACGMEGAGRMSEPGEIVEKAVEIVSEPHPPAFPAKQGRGGRKPRR